MANDNKKEVRYTKEQYEIAVNALKKIRETFDKASVKVYKPICDSYMFCTSGCPFRNAKDEYAGSNCPFNIIRHAMNQIEKTMKDRSPLETKELTVAEIEELLGYKVKVVKE